MFNIHTELGNGVRSKGYDRGTSDDAMKVFESMVSQIEAWKDYVIDVVMTRDDGVEMRREYIGHA